MNTPKQILKSIPGTKVMQDRGAAIHAALKMMDMPTLAVIVAGLHDNGMTLPRQAAFLTGFISRIPQPAAAYSNDATLLQNMVAKAGIVNIDTLHMPTLALAVRQLVTTSMRVDEVIQLIRHLVVRAAQPLRSLDADGTHLNTQLTHAVYGMLTN